MVLIDWLFTSTVTSIGAILLYPVSKEIGKSYRKLFAVSEVSE